MVLLIYHIRTISFSFIKKNKLKNKSSNVQRINPSITNYNLHLFILSILRLLRNLVVFVGFPSKFASHFQYLKTCIFQHSTSDGHNLLGHRISCNQPTWSKISGIYEYPLRWNELIVVKIANIDRYFACLLAWLIMIPLFYKFPRIEINILFI